MGHQFSPIHHVGCSGMRCGVCNFHCPRTHARNDDAASNRSYQPIRCPHWQSLSLLFFCHARNFIHGRPWAPAWNETGKLSNARLGRSVCCLMLCGHHDGDVQSGENRGIGERRGLGHQHGDGHVRGSHDPRDVYAPVYEKPEYSQSS